LGTGLGHDFLRHIERTRVLLHLIDATQEDPIAAYHTIQDELEAYGRGLIDRPQILALNKIDAFASEEEIAPIAAQLQQLSQTPVFLISAVAGMGLDPLLQHIWQVLEESAAVEVLA
jgi:GTP-binding protein